MQVNAMTMETYCDGSGGSGGFNHFGRPGSIFKLKEAVKDILSQYASREISHLQYRNLVEKLRAAGITMAPQIEGIIKVAGIKVSGNTTSGVGETQHESASIWKDPDKSSKLTELLDARGKDKDTDKTILARIRHLLKDSYTSSGHLIRVEA